MSERDIKTTIAPASVTGGRPWPFPRGWAPGLRWNAMAWAAVALAGWSAAGLAGAMVVREHQVINHLVALAGFTPVPGPGIEIVLTDGTTTSRSIADPNAMLVQDGDLILLNMMLWYGGAQAVAINGERITAQSAITSSGPTLLINGRRTVGPFHVTAIGDPAVLRGALETRGGVVDRMQEAGLGVRIAVQRALVVPAARREQWRSAPVVDLQQVSGKQGTP
jgi:uncharacterized protein YlxW (UPF0749 family)